jgi:TRAP-type mannitol/chloroaromatic compound transport system permease large subunit
MLSVGLIPIFLPRIHYVDIDLHWRWFVIITITGQLFTEFLNLQLPALDFNLLRRWANSLSARPRRFITASYIRSRLMAVISTPFFPSFTPE